MSFYDSGGGDDGLSRYRQELNQRFGAPGEPNKSSANKSRLSSFSFASSRRQLDSDDSSKGTSSTGGGLMSKFGLSGWAKPAKDDPPSSDDEYFEDHFVPEEKKVEEVQAVAETGEAPKEARPWRMGSRLWSTGISAKDVSTNRNGNAGGAQKQDDAFDVVSQFDVGRWQEVDNDTVFEENFGNIWDDATFTPEEQKGKKYTYSAGKASAKPQPSQKHTYSAGRVSSAPAPIAEEDEDEEDDEDEEEELPVFNRREELDRKTGRRKSEHSLQVSIGESTVPTSNLTTLANLNKVPDDSKWQSRHDADQPPSQRTPFGQVQGEQRVVPSTTKRSQRRYSNQMPPVEEDDGVGQADRSKRRSKSRDSDEDPDRRRERRSRGPEDPHGSRPSTRHEGANDNGTEEAELKPRKSEKRSKKSRRIKDEDSVASSRHSVASSKPRRSSRDKDESHERRKAERTSTSKTREKKSRRKSLDGGDAEVKKRSSKSRSREEKASSSDASPRKRSSRTKSGDETPSRRRSSIKHSTESDVNDTKADAVKKKKSSRKSPSKSREERKSKKESAPREKKTEGDTDAPKKKAKKKSSKSKDEKKKRVKSGLSKKNGDRKKVSSSMKRRTD